MTRMLEDVDPTGTLRGGLEEALGTTRCGFLLGLLAAAAATVAGPQDAAQAGRLSESDVAILQFDLQFEYLQAAMYTEAVRIGHLTPKARDVARVIGAHEWAHARAIRHLLGSRAVKRAHFDYHGVTEHQGTFIRTAVAFEDLTAALLKYQALRLDSKSVLAAAASLHSVEARHAAWMRRLAGRVPTLTAFDQPKSQDAAKELILDTGFVRSDPKTHSSLAPGFTG
jgi:Ferritin-like domain